MASSTRRAYTVAEVLDNVLQSKKDSEDDLDELLTEEEFHTFTADQNGLESDREEDVGGGEEQQDPCSEVDSDDSDPTPSSKRPRTAKRLANSINAAIDEDNYDELELPEQTIWHTWKAKVGPVKSKTAEPISWTDQPPEQRGRQTQCNIAKSKLGLTTEAPPFCGKSSSLGSVLDSADGNVQSLVMIHMLLPRKLLPRQSECHLRLT